MRAPAADIRIEGWLGPAGAAYGIIKPIVQVVTHPLDAVTGDPEGLREKAKAWRDAATQTRTIVAAEESARRGQLGTWRGGAAIAYGKQQDELNDGLRELADTWDKMAEGLETAATGAEEAQNLVEELIKELIIWLIVFIIVALASSWITAGASVAAGAAAGVARTAVTAGRCVSVATRLAAVLRRAQAFLRLMSMTNKATKITKIKQIGGVRNLLRAKFLTPAGRASAATDLAIKETIVAPIVKPPLKNALGLE
jgi:uncharacterized protein YukE